MTNKRQLRLTISAILESHGVDDLALESKLTDAVTLFFEKTQKGDDAVKVRGTILDGMIQYLDRQRQYEDMANRIAKALRVTPNGNDAWNEVIKFCLSCEKKGQKIEEYGRWMTEEKYSAPKVAQIALKPGVIKDTWIAAFPERLPEIFTPVFHAPAAPAPQMSQADIEKVNAARQAARAALGGVK